MILEHLFPRWTWRLPQTRSDAEVRIVEGHATLDVLEPAWNRMAAPAAEPTAQFPWVSAAAKTFAGPASLRVFLGYVHGRLTVAAPLVLRQEGGFASLHALGVEELYEPTDLPGIDAGARRAVAATIAATRLPLSLRRLPSDSPWIGCIRRAHARTGCVIVSPAPGTPLIDLDSTWCEPQRHFNAGRRSDLRRARRHAEALGPVRAEVLAPRNGAQLAKPLAEAFTVEGAGWKGERGSAMSVNPVRGDFFRRYAERAAAAGILRLCFLRIGDAAVAMQLAVECAGRFYLLKIGYDERFSRCSPGMLLMSHTVAYAASRGLRSYELLGTPEPWTRLWTTRIRPCVALRAYPLNAAGARAFVHDAARRVRRGLSSRP